MIIDFQHSFKDYDEILNFYGIWNYSCPKCGARHSLVRHGTYERSIILWEKGCLSETKGKILRLQCSSCEGTHAVLTMDTIPFFLYSMAAFLSLVELCLAPDGSVPKTEKQTGVSIQLLYRFLVIFNEYRERLSILLRQESLWDASANPLPREISAILSAQPPPRIESAFLQTFRAPMFLRRRSTVSYPLRFGTAEA